MSAMNAQIEANQQVSPNDIRWYMQRLDRLRGMLEAQKQAPEALSSPHPSWDVLDDAHEDGASPHAISDPQDDHHEAAPENSAAADVEATENRPCEGEDLEEGEGELQGEREASPEEPNELFTDVPEEEDADEAKLWSAYHGFVELGIQVMAVVDRGNAEQHQCMHQNISRIRRDCRCGFAALYDAALDGSCQMADVAPLWRECLELEENMYSHLFLAAWAVKHQQQMSPLDQRPEMLQSVLTECARALQGCTEKMETFHRAKAKVHIQGQKDQDGVVMAMPCPAEAEHQVDVVLPPVPKHKGVWSKFTGCFRWG
eukprot:TRINITY_DN4105_c0_g1_i5.p1 TRINITY_DN4105_c0_g1~~TRINITY_DN4105_c0_g1_i5.p1  ORF type:complete len:315 (+),score=68.67 TRINITY_DN4105_c0_g1_i5:502-1446(+)